MQSTRLFNLRSLTLSQPLTLREFMNYLLYIEHSAENLQFYLWHQDYIKRFHEETSPDMVLAHEWTKAQEDEIITRLQKEATENQRRDPAIAAKIFKGTDFEKRQVDVVDIDPNPFSSPPMTPLSAGDRESTYAPSTQPSTALTYSSMASDAFSAAGAKRPCKYLHPPLRCVCL